MPSTPEGALQPYLASASSSGGGGGGGSSGGGGGALAHEGLQVFTLGHLLPRSSVEDENGNWSFDARALNGLLPLPLGEGQGDEQGEYRMQDPQQDFGAAGPSGAGASSASGSGGGGAGAGGAGGEGMARPSSAQTLRVRRSAFVPGWAVPPRVLLVEDDAVSRRLSSKFLQVFGCTIDVAVDGVGAVNKMNLEKYDLVLMVRVSRLSSTPGSRVSRGALIVVVFADAARVAVAGYRDAEAGRGLRDVAHPPVRPHDAHHFHDEQFEAERDHDLLSLGCVRRPSFPHFLRAPGCVGVFRWAAGRARVVLLARLLACSGPGRSRRVGLMVMVMLGADDRLFVSA